MPPKSSAAPDASYPRATLGVSPRHWLEFPNAQRRFAVASAQLGRSGRLWRLTAGVLAIVATAALTTGVAWATTAAWVFNVVGAGELLYAFYKGARLRLEPDAPCAAFYIVTAVVPLLLTTHVLIFMLLIRFRT